MDGYVGEIRMMPYSFIPQGWYPCDGRILPINLNQALFSVIGNTYGGSMQNQNFAVPNLQSLVPVGLGTANQGAGITNWTINYKNTVEETVTLSASTTPQHSHTVTAKITAPSAWKDHMKAKPANDTYLSKAIKPKPAGQTGYETIPLYNVTEPVPGKLPLDTIGVACGNGAYPPVGHENRQPYLAMGFFICADGEYPISS